ncbi:DUF1194 domain-containing protein [Acidimangrovimonas sediminis]|uniref:DUF1194 domain-containing protein n=1 Tax=Acidimangrovimonas sediminis TaxID=2056283 RepID=UPI000C7F8CFB|nr:DUF1194 domain-containing protein [Acidimangrovimonas sediminis]
MIARCLLALALTTAPAAACETALLLAMDVSGSIDAGEYRLQLEGLAAALSDPTVVEALVSGGDLIAVMQWSGAGQTRLSLGWTEVTTPAAAMALAARVRALPRAFGRSDTAVGDAIAFAADQFSGAARCRRHVTDISGDGPVNAGRPVGPARHAAELRGITLNGLAIDDMGRTVTNFYAGHVATRDGFVVTARGHEDYHRAIRLKLIRELNRPSS